MDRELVDDIMEDYPAYIGPKWIAIVGNTRSIPVMDDYAVKCIDKALAQNNFIMFGDSPKGIDWAILKHLAKAKINRIQFTICTAVGEHPRNLARLQEQDFSSKRRFEDYHSRDCNMIEFADVTMCIWDGESKGVKMAFDYARSIQRQAYLVTWKNGKPVLESSI